MTVSYKTLGAAALLLTRAACASEPAGDAPRVEGEGTNLRTVEVRQGGKRYLVYFFNRGAGAQRVTVRTTGFRPLDRSSGQAALEAAAAAGDQIDCGNGAPVRIDPETAFFEEQDRAGPGALGGQASWTFQGQCGG